MSLEQLKLDKVGLDMWPHGNTYLLLSHHSNEFRITPLKKNKYPDIISQRMTNEFVGTADMWIKIHLIPKTNHRNIEKSVIVCYFQFMYKDNNRQKNIWIIWVRIKISSPLVTLEVCSHSCREIAQHRVKGGKVPSSIFGGKKFPTHM